MLTKLIPDLKVDTIYDIDLDALSRQGIKGIITDLDNTLIGANSPDATPELLEWIQLVRRKGFNVVIVSNNHRTRVSRFADAISIPYLYRAKKPSNKAFRTALSIMSLSNKETAVIGDQMLTDILGGNRMGLFTILVIPISLGDEGFFTRINRRLEKAAIMLMKRGRNSK